MKKACLLLAACCFLALSVHAQRYAADLSGAGWKLWHDVQAEWKNDSLPLEPVLSELPARIPTGGWNTLETNGLAVSVPGTKVALEVRDRVAVADLSVHNLPAMSSVDARLDLENTTGKTARRHISVSIEERSTGKVVLGRTLENQSIPVGASTRAARSCWWVGTAMGIVRMGEGHVLFSTLDIYDNVIDTNPDNTPTLVAKKLLLNMIDNG